MIKKGGNMHQNLADLLGDQKLTLVDAGARNGIFSLDLLDPFVNAYGLEPNEEEYQLLKQSGIRFNNARFYKDALAGMTGMAGFYYAKHPSYHSLLEPDPENYRKYTGMMKDHSEWISNISTVRKSSIPVITLDDFCDREKIHQIDFLKLDTQGNELDILKGAQSLINKGRIRMIYTEVAFITVYKGQTHFSELDNFLRSKGYLFVDCRFNSVRNEAQYTSTGGRLYEQPRVSSGGDAIYIKDFSESAEDNTHLNIVKTGLLLANLQYFSLANHILTSYGGIDAGHCKKIFLLFNRSSSFHRLKKMIKMTCPPFLLPYLGGFRKLFQS